MSRAAVVEIHKDEFDFSAGHFTIFSATEREDLHGHNYNVSIALHVILGSNGLSFDYRIYKKKILAICNTLDRKFMLPSQSPFLRIEDQENGMVIAHYGEEKIPFLKRDAVILPITNVTIEELAHWFLNQLTENKIELDAHQIQKIKLSVYNGPGQSGTAKWKK